MPSYRSPLGENEFAQGVVQYSDYSPDQQHSRIILPVAFGDLITTAVVDTGAPWCILNPEEARVLGIDYAASCDWQERLIIRGIVYDGWLCNTIPVSLMAGTGIGITVQALVFIAELSPDQPWHHPNFLGLGGFLERIRFAVDPGNNLFYFGSLTG